MALKLGVQYMEENDGPDSLLPRNFSEENAARVDLE